MATDAEILRAKLAVSEAEAVKYLTQIPSEKIRAAMKLAAVLEEWHCNKSDFEVALRIWANVTLQSGKYYARHREEILAKQKAQRATRREERRAAEEKLRADRLLAKKTACIGAEPAPAASAGRTT
jgi:hypothetical protein